MGGSQDEGMGRRIPGEWTNTLPYERTSDSSPRSSSACSSSDVSFVLYKSPTTTTSLFPFVTLSNTLRAEGALLGVAIGQVVLFFCLFGGAGVYTSLG